MIDHTLNSHLFSCSFATADFDHGARGDQTAVQQKANTVVNRNSTWRKRNQSSGTDLREATVDQVNAVYCQSWKVGQHCKIVCSSGKADLC